MKKKQHNCGKQTAMTRLHQIGFVSASFTSEDSHFLHSLSNNGSSVASCKASGLGSSRHTLAVVYLEEEDEEWEQPWGSIWDFSG